MTDRKGSKKPHIMFTLGVSFPKSPKKAKERKILFTKMETWVNEHRKTFSVNDIEFRRRMNLIAFIDDDIVLGVSFRKPIQVRIGLTDPDSSLKAANVLGNQILIYLNALLGKEAKGVTTKTSLDIFRKQTSKLPKRILGESRLAELSEIARTNLFFNGAILTCKIDDRNFFFLIYGRENVDGRYFSSERELMDVVPLDILKSEYEVLSKSKEILKRLERSDI